jgi:hypothetical protein
VLVRVGCLVSGWGDVCDWGAAGGVVSVWSGLRWVPGGVEVWPSEL